MAQVTTDPHPVDVRAAAAAPEPSARPATSPWIPVLLVYTAAAVLYSLLALAVQLPTVFPDELRYSQLARSLVHGHGFVWRGEGHANAVHQPTALYVYFLAPLWWLFDSAVHARDASKVLGTLVLCTQVVPVWLLARPMVGPRLALVPATLAVAGTWMTVGAMTLTEVLALPLTTAALCCAAMALRRPGSRAGYAAIAFALLATWARIQLVVLVPVLLLAFALDVLRVPGERRVRLRAHRAVLVVTGALTAAMVLVSLARPGAAGDYSTVLTMSLPSLALVARKTGLELLELVVLAGFVPVLLAAAAATSPRLWRDDRTGPLLAVFWPAALVLALQSGLYLATATFVLTGVERYVMYAAPIALVLGTVLLAEPRLLPRGGFALAALLALTLLAMPLHQLTVIEPAVWATGQRVKTLTGLARPEALAAAGVAATLLVWIVRRHARGVAGFVAASTVVFGVLAVQDHAAWQKLITVSADTRALLPRDLSWIDDAGPEPVAVLGVGTNAPQLPLVAYYNSSIAQSFVLDGKPAQGPNPEGLACAWVIGDRGVLSFGPTCGATPHRILLQDRAARLRFYGETTSIRRPTIGRLVELDPGAAPRLQSMLTLPCDTPALPAFTGSDDDVTIPASALKPCAPAVAMGFWLDRPAKVTIVFRGGPQDQHAALGPNRYTIRANRLTRIEGSVPRGDSRFTMDLDWNTSAGPRLVQAQIRSAGVTRSLIP
ncbi:MAG TPA: hypothetical protein VK501_27360 [Baekduia sp.]|uniref:hypothetical protein n=1 Tax=Baekduia sp. TaxID=2600305 RepID=UPI002B93FEF3|nr:hypothetical protein [Baekduia sp.]HMJ37655.1 hypothetical protein [Baekduia sp.]